MSDSNMRLALILLTALGVLALGASIALNLYGIVDIDNYTQLASTVVGIIGGILMGKNL